MSAFEDFVQTELPKRGYLNSDVDAETIIIRRGTGPRQFDAVVLTEGQVLAKVNGLLTGVQVSAVGGGVRKAIVDVSSAVVTWTVQHNLDSTNVIIQATDEDGFVIIPNSIQIVDANNVALTFSAPQAGTARIIFLD